MTNPRIHTWTADECRRRIADTLATIHVPITEDELRRPVDADAAREHELGAWEELRTMRFLLGKEG